MYALSTALKNKSADPVPKTIVFCRTKDKACQVYSLLKTASSPGVVSMYHASFQCGFLQGMDIPDIELVVVLGMPDTIAEFYQVCVST